MVTTDTGVYRFVNERLDLCDFDQPDGLRANKDLRHPLDRTNSRNVPIKLAIGQASTQVNVNAEAQLLDTGDSRNEHTLQ